MVLVNLIAILSWRKQLIQEEREARVKAEIKMLDEVIACLEKVLAGCEVCVGNPRFDAFEGIETVLTTTYRQRKSTRRLPRRIIISSIWTKIQVCGHWEEGAGRYEGLDGVESNEECDCEKGLEIKPR